MLIAESWADADSPLQLVASALQLMYSIKDDPDFILWTGDNSPYVTETNVSVIEVLVRSTELFRLAFPKTRVLPLFGK